MKARRTLESEEVGRERRGFQDWLAATADASNSFTLGPRPALGTAIRTRVLLLGILWLAWMWALAIICGRIAPERVEPHNWERAVEERITPLTRWDSGWYLGMARSGYGAPPLRFGEETNHAFFPIYPLAMGLLSHLTGMELSLSGNVLSGLALMGVLLLFSEWIRVRHGAVGPTLSLLLFFPTSLFFAAVYTESFFLFFALGAVVAVDRDCYALAAAVGFMAGLTRIGGLALSPYLFLVAFAACRRRGLPRRDAVQRAIVPAGGPLLGFAALCSYFWCRFDDFFLFVKAQGNWGDKGPRGFLGLLRAPWDAVRTVLADLATGRVWRLLPARTLEGAFILVAAVLTILLVRHGRLPEAFYVAATIGLVLLSGTFESAGRYVLVAFPAFAVAGNILAGRRRTLFLVIGLSALTQAFFVWRFVHWYWVG